ncbi:MAG: glycoside hydrolase family 2 [Ruminococcaceae bacterium]|nr:glycoside hydrolase family 2 [Oscillospiraceae bacterium]
MEKLYTPEGELLQGQPWQVYPRPQLKRKSFYNLNGLWDFTVDEKNFEINVPFPPESLLSGLDMEIPPGTLMQYSKNFTLPEGFVKDRVLLHFGAVDQECEVYLNGEFIGDHKGGYEHFTFEITDFLKDENVLEVKAWDNLGDNILPYGKQTLKRGGMWYTPVSGIWQTVWIESVPEHYVKSLKIDVGTDFARIWADGVYDGKISVTTPQGILVSKLVNGVAEVDILEPCLWSPEHPYLYYFVLESGKDRVESYFALRTLEIKKIDGVPRLCLNGEPYFFNGLLDQGYYSDGIFTPADPVCFESEIKIAKSLGFNMLRKHIKVEPEQFYYDCDRFGMVVFQDMVNNGKYSFIRDTALPTIGLKRLCDKKMHTNPESRKAFCEAMESTVKDLYNHPCICYWTIFNEGWGQFSSTEMYHKLKALDSSRFIDSASGWFSGGESDVESLHVYFKKFKMPKRGKRPVVLSEFGGYSYKPEGHVFNKENTYGYRFFKEIEEFKAALKKLYNEEIYPAIPKGLCAAVYTQLSDVEDETNGLISYDRKVVKIEDDFLK